ncbi:MAG: T9SS type A sorting domain-containing protein, partial [Bacteroidota bacterium]
STVIYGGRPGINVSIDSVMLFWQTNNGCDSEPIVEELPDTDPDDESTVTKFTYQNCEDGLEVQLLRVNGGAHTWPGATFAFDVTNQDINASREIWNFFNRFSLDEVTNTTTAVAQELVDVFPNPTTGLIQIQTTSAVSVQLFDSFGQRILQEQNLTRPSLDISALPAGLYVLQVRAEGGQLQNFKVVKR